MRRCCKMTSTSVRAAFRRMNWLPERVIVWFTDVCLAFGWMKRESRIVEAITKGLGRQCHETNREHFATSQFLTYEERGSPRKEREMLLGYTRFFRVLLEVTLQYLNLSEPRISP